MTHIVKAHSKKYFKEIADHCILRDPSIIDDFSGTVAECLEHAEKHSQTLTVTNPQRSWFASVRRLKNGKIKIE